MCSPQPPLPSALVSDISSNRTNSFSVYFAYVLVCQNLQAPHPPLSSHPNSKEVGDVSDTMTVTYRRAGRRGGCERILAVLTKAQARLKKRSSSIARGNKDRKK
ncbi:hypothetical protein RRG08_033636 [Elysia crispata]|uniref:Uncharacterized protein n=1 Tax=Elysia crispata TaxID=231223 RepID=A0AAE1CKI8_9GAST|nr:hypothetical protein RRG08_033636 [Elysia crispata]